MHSIKELIGRYDHLKTQRDNWNSHYQELADYMLPRKADVVKSRSKGDKRMELIFDGTALQAVDLLSSSLHGLLTSGAAPWFHLDMKDEEIGRDDDVREWLQDTSQRMLRGFDQSNFGTEVHEMYVDLVVFGTGCMFKWKKTRLDSALGTYQNFTYKKISLVWLIQCFDHTNLLCVR